MRRFFHAQKFISVDCSPKSGDDRGAYNAAKVDHPDFLRVGTTRRAPIEATGLDANNADLVIVPNVVHHVADQGALFSEMARVTRPGGRVYVFEPTLRELHQIPDDFLRYTPFGMQFMMRGAGLVPDGFELEGGPFSAIGYCWTQALEFFPPDKRAEMAQWFYDEHLPQLLRWESAYPRNLERRHTMFPVSFSVVASKPADAC